MAETIIRIATITSAILRRRASLAASAALLAARAASHVAAAASRAISACSRLDVSLRWTGWIPDELELSMAHYRSVFLDISACRSWIRRGQVLLIKARTAQIC